MNSRLHLFAKLFCAKYPSSHIPGAAPWVVLMCAGLRDVANEADVRRCLEQTLEWGGRLDGLVNNAGLVDGGMTRKIIYE